MSDCWVKCLNPPFPSHAYNFQLQVKPTGGMMRSLFCPVFLPIRYDDEVDVDVYPFIHPFAHYDLLMLTSSMTWDVLIEKTLSTILTDFCFNFPDVTCFTLTFINSISIMELLFRVDDCHLMIHDDNDGAEDPYYCGLQARVPNFGGRQRKSVGAVTSGASAMNHPSSTHYNSNNNAHQFYQSRDHHNPVTSSSSAAAALNLHHQQEMRMKSQSNGYLNSLFNQSSNFHLPKHLDKKSSSTASYPYYDSSLGMLMHPHNLHNFNIPISSWVIIMM